ncbi:MAG: hypothetical protein CV087_23235, partial [Candidatus Brocadia sp. WS118]
TVPHNHRAIIYYGPYIGSTALFFKKAIIEEGILVNEKFKYTMDWEWYAHLGSLGKKFTFINETFAGFRLHSQNQSQKYRQMAEIDKLFNRAQQLAEGYTIKRYYGYRFTKKDSGSLLEEFCLRLLWWYYRCIVLAQKLFYLLRYNPSEVKEYIKRRNVKFGV